MVLVTQLGKVGALVQATIPPTIPVPEKPESPASALPEPPVAISLTHLMGTAQDIESQTVTDIYVSQIATLVWCYMSGVRNPVVVGLALKRRPAPEIDGSGDADYRTKFIETMCLVVDGLVQLEGSQTTAM